MGIKHTSKFSSGGKKSRIVNLPEKNEHVTVPVSPDENVVLNFSLDGVNSRSEGDTLILECPDGQCIYLPGALADGGGLIRLSNGKLVTVDELLEMQSKSQSLETSEGDLQGGVDRLGALDGGGDSPTREPLKAESPNQNAQSQGSGSDGGSSASAGSGVGEFRSDTGDLVGGIWALPDQLTEYWGWNSANEREPEGILGGSSSSGPQPGTSVIVSGASVNESATHISFSIAVATKSGDCALSFTLGGGTAVSGEDYLPALEYYDGSAWILLTPDAGGVYTVNVPGGAGTVQLQLPLIDDAMSERSETIGLTVTGISKPDGTPVTDFTSDTRLQGAATIVEDSQINTSGTPTGSAEKDGPVISVTRVSPLFVNETDIPGFPPSSAHTTGGGNEHTFRLDLKDCLTPSLDFAGVPDPAGLPGDRVLLQDITISLKLDGTATLGGDYAFSPSPALQALISAGKATLTPLDGDNAFTLTLHGRYDANGNLHPDANTRAFDVDDFADLTFVATVDYDTSTELPESIVLAITGVQGNEAHADPDKSKATGMIADNVNNQAGPILSLTSPANTTEGASFDPANAPADKTDWHTISLHVAAPDPIRTIVTLDGTNANSVRYDGTNAENADFKWTGTVEYSTDGGATWQTMPAANYAYNETTGECALTIPVNATDVRFGVTTIDDMRETGDAASEGYNVTLELVEDTPGETDAAAVLSGNVASITNNTAITPETRQPGALNPADFDGPYVTVEAGTASPVAESGGNTLPYAVKLKNPDGTGTLFDATTENVNVTLTVTGSDGFQIQDLFAPTNSSGAFSGTITYQAYDASGSPVGGLQTVTVTGNGTTLSGSDASFSFTATLPPGAAEIKIEIPVNDDALGGTSSGTSALERLNETVTLEITAVTGNESRVDGNDTAAVTITDDTAAASFEGVKVGLSWQGTNDTDKIVNEGATGVIMLRLFNNNGSDFTASPYLNYTGDAKLPEDLSVKLSFADTAGTDGDMALKFTTQFLALVTAGKVEVTIGGTTYTTAAALQGVELDGEFTVTLKGGSFDLSADLGSLSFNAHAFGDNVAEYKDGSGTYGTAADEQFSLAVTEVSGNESSIKTGAATATGTITDRPDGTLSITGGNLDPSNGTDPGSWDFTIAVKYTDNERANHPANSTAAGNASSGSVVAVPGEDTVITIRVTDGEVMEHGQEYTVSAYEIFLSVNNLTAGDVSKTDYDAGTYTAQNHWIIVTQNGAWADNGSGNDTVTFDLAVPKEYWTTAAGSGGEIDITISQGDRVGAITTGGNGGFTVNLETPSSNAGEITGADPSKIIAAAMEDTTLNIHMTLQVTPTVYENESSDGAKDNIATFTMQFSQFRNGTAVNTPFCMGREFSFEFTLRGSGSADLNTDSEDNTLYPDLGHFALCDENGDISSYGDINELTANLQTILTGQYGVQADGSTPNVSIALVSDAGDIKFKITVSEGVDLSQGIDLHFVAMDNNTTDAGRTINGVISNIECSDPVITIQIKQDGGTATIRDEQGDPSGFAIALGDGYGYEKTVGADAVDGNGVALDGKIHIPVYAYILSNGNMPGSTVADGNILSFAELVNIYNAKNSGSPLTAAQAVTDVNFRDFIEDNFSPTQDITITIGLSDGANSAVTEDYKNKTSETLDASDWTLVIHEDGQGNVYVYFENECTVESIDDTFSMITGQDVDFTVTVNASSNNESRPVQAGSGGRDENQLADGHGSASTGTILDYHNGPKIMNLGPVDGSAYEPNDTAHGPVSGSQHVAADKATAYTIQLDKATTEDMVVWLDISDNGATHGVDYGFGAGLYLYESGTYYKFKADGTTEALTPAEIAALPPYIDAAAQDGNYFVVIESGNSSASFNVLVKDDNNTETNENVNFKVTDVQGGEAVYTETVNGAEYVIPWAKDVPYVYCVEKAPGTFVEVLVDPANNCYRELASGTLVTWADGSEPAWLRNPNDAGYSGEGTLNETLDKDLLIADDGNGPVVSIVNTGAAKVAWEEHAEAPTVTVTMEDYCQQDVTVSLRLSISGQGERILTLTMPEGEITHTFTAAEINTLWVQAGGTALTGADRKSFDVQIMNSSGGETDYNDGIIRVIIRDDTNPAVRFYDLEPMIVTEGWMAGVAGDADGAIVLKMDIPGSGDLTITGGVFFTVSVNTSPLFSGDTAQVYRVELTQAQTAELQSLGGTFTFKIVMNGGTPEVQIYDTSNTLVTLTSPTVSVSLTGGTTLPEALGDDVIGDRYGVGMSIAGSGSNPANSVPTYIDSTSINSVIIQDGTNARLLIFVEDGGNWKLVDGSTLSENEGTLKMKAVLVLVDEHGHLVTVDGSGNVTARFDTDGNLYDAAGTSLGTNLPGDILLSALETVRTTDPLEFDINYGDYTTGVDRAAEEGKDYTGSEKVRIDGGQSSGEFTVTVTNDDITEGREGLSLSLEATQETKNSAGHVLGQIVDETGTPVSGGIYGNADVVIEDDGSGPIIKWDISATSVREDGSLELTWESFSRNDDGSVGGREIVAEDVALEFEITPRADFTLSEIESITIDGQTYLNGSAEFNALITDNGATWTLSPTFKGGTGLGGLTIKFKDDVISEINVNEGFDIKLKDAVGSESHIAKNPDSSDIEKSVDVTETRSGPIMDLVATSAEEGGDAVYTLTFSGGKATEQAATVELTLNAESLALLQSGANITITFPDSSTQTVTPAEYASGTFTVNLPTGIQSGDAVTVAIPIQNSASAEEKKFGVSLGTPVGGELGVASAAAYQSKFVNETGGDTTNGGTKTLSVYTTDSLVNCEGALRFDIGGMTQEAAVKDVQLTVNGVTVTLDKSTSGGPEPGKWYWNDTTKKIEIITETGQMRAEYEVTVVFTKDHPDLSDCKLDMCIDNPQIVNREVGITVEKDTANPDGPLVGLEITPGAIEEGVNDITGKVKVALADDLLEGNATIDDIVITLTVAPSGADFTPAFNPAWMTKTGDTVVITIPEGTTIPAGGFDLGFSMDVPDNSTQTNPEYKITVTKVHGADESSPVYEQYAIDSANAAKTVTPADGTANLTGPLVSVENTTIGIPVESADNITGTVKVALAHAAAAEGSATLDDIVISLTVSPSGAEFTPSFNAAWMERTGDTIVITIPQGTTIPSGGFDLGFTMPVPDNAQLLNPAYTVTVNSVTGAGGNTDVYEQYTVDTANDDISVTPANEGANLDGPEINLADLSGDALEGAGSITGKVTVDLGHGAIDGTAARGELVIELTLGSDDPSLDPTAMAFALTGSLSGCSFTQSGASVFITIDAGVAIPPGGLEFAVDVPAGSLGANYTVTLANVTDTAGVYEDCSIGAAASGGGEIVATLPFAMPFAAFALFDDNGDELGGLLETGLANLAAFTEPLGTESLETGENAPVQEAAANNMAGAATWGDTVADPAAAYGEQALLLMKIMTETGSA